MIARTMIAGVPDALEQRQSQGNHSVGTDLVKHTNQ